LKTSLLTKVLFQLTETELNQFDLFLKSPFFKQPPHIAKLFKYLTANNQKKTPISKENAFRYCFAKKRKFDPLLMNNTIAILLQQIELFLAHQQLQDDSLLQNELTLNAYRKKNLYPVFKKRSISLGKKLADAPTKKAATFLRQFQNNFDLYFHPATEKQNSKEGPSIALMSEQLDDFYSITKIKLALESHARHQLLLEKEELYFLAEAVNHVNNRTGGLFQLYSSMYEFLSQPLSEKNFDKAHKTLLQHSHLLPPEQQATLLVLLLNKVNLLVNREPKKYRKLHHELHKFGIDRDLFTQNGFINGALFFNIITIAAILGEFRFANIFLKSNAPFLPSEIKSDILLLSQCFLYFHKGKIRAADNLFQKLSFKNKQYKILANSLHFRCLYELAFLKVNDEPPFLHFANNFVKYLNRNTRLNAERRASYLNMVKIARRMLQTKRMTTVQKRKAIKKIQELLKNTVVAKEWLHQKLQQL